MRLSDRLRHQDGFTVIEVLVAMIVLGFVVAGALTMMQVVMRQGRGVLERTDAAQHGRLALDRMTRQIRSQVCRDQFTRGLISASPTELSFYTDLGNGTTGPSMHKLTFDPAQRRVTETVFLSKTAPPAAPSYGVTPDRKDVTILKDVVPDTDAGNSALPFFTYYAYENGVNGPAPTLKLPSSGPLSPTDLPSAAVVHLQFKVRPTGARDDTFAVRMQDDVFFRNADPNAARPEPKCT